MNQEDLQIGQEMNRIAADASIVAQVESEKPVCLEGTITGSVRCSSRLEIRQGGLVKGEVRCGTLVLEGMVDGNVEADRAILGAAAEIKGALLTGRLEIAAGAKIGLGLKFKNKLK